MLSCYVLFINKGITMRWDKELPFIISEQTGYEEVYIGGD